jgi:hypothetical protein
MDEILTVLIPIAVSAVTSFLVAKFYGERWVYTRQSRKEHSVVLKDEFFKPWMEKIGEYNEYCKIDVQYSTKIGKMVPLPPKEPDNLKFYTEAMSHLKSYEGFLADWEKLKQTTLGLNGELAVLFEEMRVFVEKEIDLPYWCPKYIGDYSGDKPDEYLCPDLFIRSIYDELYGRIETRRKQIFGNGIINPTVIEKGKKMYCLFHSNNELTGSANEELMKRAQQLIGKLIDNEEYGGKVRAFINRKGDTYNKELERVKKNIAEIIKSIELGSIIKGKCSYCKNF